MHPLGTSAPSRMLLRLDQNFGLAEVSELQQALAEVTPGSHLTFDFSAVRVFQDVAVASLAQVLTRAGATVEVRGLSLHQRRMLRYFGVNLEDAGQGLDHSSA